MRCRKEIVLTGYRVQYIDLAIALVNGEVRIGRYSRHKDCELLTPASTMYNSIISDFCNPSFKIIAKAIALIGALSGGAEEAN